MTRWGFVSDIHGNRKALDQVDRIGDERGIEEYICLGDVVGRADPEGCVKWVADRTKMALVGNRDLDHIDRLSPPFQKIVNNWLTEGRVSDFVITHGDPRGHRIFRSDAQKDAFQKVSRMLEKEAARLWFFGHTHHARIWRLARKAQPHAGPPQPAHLDRGRGPRTPEVGPKDRDDEGRVDLVQNGEGRVELVPGDRYVVNVGTAGWPFPGKGGPSIVLYDDVASWVEIVPL